MVDLIFFWLVRCDAVAFENTFRLRSGNVPYTGCITRLTDLFFGDGESGTGRFIGVGEIASEDKAGEEQQNNY